MFAGHVGAALAIGRAEPRVNIGAFVAAALMLDLVLWMLVLLGWEHVALPGDFAATHQAAFDFPWSHGLVSSLAWSALAAVAAYRAWPGLGFARRRAAALVAAAVFSHWLLDAIVHRPELPLAGAGSVHLGLGLWDRMPWAIAVEAVIAVAGLACYLTAGGLSRTRRGALAVLTVVILAFTVAGLTVAPPPPSAAAMAASSWLTIVVVCALYAWIGRARAASA